MSEEKHISDQTYEDLCIHDMVVEGATQALGEYDLNDMANGLIVSFTRLRDDVKELMKVCSQRIICK